MFLVVLMQVTFPFTQVAGPMPARVSFDKVWDESRLYPANQFAGSFIGASIYDWKSWDISVWFAECLSSWDATADAPIADIEFVLAEARFPEKRAQN
jgi:hypothetical protein